MRPNISLLLAGALSCTSSASLPPDTGTDTFRSYGAGSAALQSTLLEHAELTHRTLRGHTQLADGSWSMEEATLDARGRLQRAVIDRGGPCSDHPTHIVLDALAGVVEVTSPPLHTRWSVPTDLPWVPTGWLESQTLGRSFATPVAMTIALHGASAQGAARLVDVEHYTTASIMSDQLLTSDDSPTVVLGDDYADVADGLPSRLHLAALDQNLVVKRPTGSAAWARLRCAEAAKETTL